MPGILDALSQTWPARMGRGILGAMALPGDVYAGRTQMTDPETGRTSQQAIERSADLAGIMTMGAANAPAGALGSGFVVKGFGTPVRVIQSPSQKELAGFLSRTKYKAARRITDSETGEVFVWDAADPVLHKQMAEQLGIRYDQKMGDVLTLD